MYTAAAHLVQVNGEISFKFGGCAGLFHLKEAISFLGGCISLYYFPQANEAGKTVDKYGVNNEVP